MTFYFGPFVLKPDQYSFEANGRVRHLQPKVLELLAFLVVNRDRVVSKEELLREIWHDAYVSEAAINRAVSLARKAMVAEGGSDWIRTVHGRGFRFVGPVIEDLAAPDGCAGASRLTAPGRESLSIAVLPFADLSARHDQEHLCQGVAEEILYRLTQVVGLRVTARGVSFQYGALADPREVGRRVGADLVLAGTIRKEGDQRRIGVEVTNTRSGRRVWSEQWQRHCQHLFALQDQTATLIAETLQLHLAPGTSRFEVRRTASSQAYDLYLRGRKLYHQARKSTYYEARRLFAKAIHLDPGYALAHAASAACSAYLYLLHEPVEKNLRLADESSQRALKIASDVAETHSARAMTLSAQGRPEEAEVHFRRAIAHDPASFDANYNFARQRFAQGRMEQAVGLFFRAIEADPTAFAPCSICGSALRALGRTTEAERIQELALNRVRRQLRRYPDDQRALCLGAVNLARNGQTVEALEWSAKAKALDPRDAMVLYNLACVAALCGDRDASLRLLGSAIEHGYPHLSWIENDSDLAALRSSSRLQKIVAPLRAHRFE